MNRAIRLMLAALLGLALGACDNGTPKPQTLEAMRCLSQCAARCAAECLPGCLPTKSPR